MPVPRALTTASFNVQKAMNICCLAKASSTAAAVKQQHHLMGRGGGAAHQRTEKAKL